MRGWTYSATAVGRHTAWLVAVMVLAGMSARAGEVLAGAPTHVSVTIYRAPRRDAGAMQLNSLQGFALVSETRLVRLPAGRSRVGFEGVANGIEPASALVTGIPSGLIEKDQDARLLSPSALKLATVGKPLELVRTNRKTGVTTRTPVTLEAASDDGVVFKSEAGIEAWQCTGLSETFEYASVDGLSAAPKLSVTVNSKRPRAAVVTLSYLARGFDWFAEYTAQMSADGTSLDLGAWVTLANGNDVSFPAASAKVVAGRVNRTTGEVEPIDIGPQVLAHCWPQETTSDLPAVRQPPRRAGLAVLMNAMPMEPAPTPEHFAEVIVTGMRRVTQEQLGDLKLYGVPERTTVAARQSKQVRLLDRARIPITVVYGADLLDSVFGQSAASMPATRFIRTKNTKTHHLGLALPSGRVAVFERAGSEWLLISESGLRDVAVDEEVEIDAGASADVRVAQVHDSEYRDSVRHLRVEVSNARASAVHVELKTPLRDGEQLLDADHAVTQKNGRSIFKFSVPAGATESVRFAVRSP